MTDFERGGQIAAEASQLTPRELVLDISRFDDSLQARIFGMEVEHFEDEGFGAYLNGELQPSEIGEIDEEAVEGWIQLTDAYQWALAVARYPYRHQADQDAVKESTVSGLFRAVNGFNPSRDPDFLVYLSDTLTQQMVEDHGVPPEGFVPVPTPAEFDEYVSQNYLADFPPLPDKRLPEHVSEGTVVMVFEEDKLVSGVVKKVIDREHAGPFTINDIPEEEIPALQERLDQAYAQVRAEGTRITLGDPAADYEETAEFEAKMNPPADELAPSVRLIHALGRGPLWLYRLYPQLKENPDTGPSTALVVTDAHPDGAEVTIRNSVLITEADLKFMASHPLYREAYLDRSTAGDEQQRQVLGMALLDRKYAGDTTIKPPAAAAHFRKRARHTTTEIRKARIQALVD